MSDEIRAPYFSDWLSTPGTEVVPGDVVWAVTGEQLQVIKSVMNPGLDFPLHSHSQEQIIVVISGALEFTVGSVTKVVRAGGVIHAPPGVYHGGRTIGHEPVVTVEAFHPSRADFAGGSSAVDMRAPR